MPPGGWTDSTERNLLLTIIHLTAPQLPKWDQVAALMGDGFTAESTRQRFQKMRKDCKAEFGEPAAAPGGTPSKATSRKAKASAPNGETPSKSTGKRKAGKTAVDADDSEEGGSPTKKQAVKKEEDGFESGELHGF
ncbi:hypothetical protein LTR37_010255 [Vermiconidia calcicola]|uniref:Uncharacterized protein n=1 Tax=Vermiconidia calcicola TaxID=1690605 RepID=A0ACC3N696_9PEZI|nr:hypothetical protein LTR37_010255 [Vermiconidia calcicola]